MVSTNTVPLRQIVDLTDRAGIQDQTEVFGGKVQGTAVSLADRATLFTQQAGSFFQ